MEGYRAGTQNIPGEELSIKNDWGKGGKVWTYLAKGELNQKEDWNLIGEEEGGIWDG